MITKHEGVKMIIAVSQNLIRVPDAELELVRPEDVGPIAVVIATNNEAVNDAMRFNSQYVDDLLGDTAVPKQPGLYVWEGIYNEFDGDGELYIPEDCSFVGDIRKASSADLSQFNLITLLP